MLINNGYKQTDIEKQIKSTLDEWYKQTPQKERNNNEIKLFYQGIMHSQYKNEEKAMKSIIYRNVKPTNQEKEIKLTIYYKSKKASNLVMKNNPRPDNDISKKRMVVYQFKCPYEGGCPHTYIGMTSMCLAKRISCHCQEGNIFHHITHAHRQNPTKKEIENSFSIIGQTNDQTRLKFLEALLIDIHKPTLNVTNEILILPTLKRRRTVGNNPTPSPPADLLDNHQETNSFSNTQEERLNQTHRYNLRPRPNPSRQIHDLPEPR